MRKKENKDIKIIGTIPYGLSLFEAPFGILDTGGICELSSQAQKVGLLVIKRIIKNLTAAIRMYIVYILGRYLKTLKGIKGVEVPFLGKLEEVDRWTEKLANALNEFKTRKPVKELEKVIDEIEQKTKPLIAEIKKKEISIGKWALQKARVLIQEKKRINDILEKVFVEMIKLYDICNKNSLEKISPVFKEYLFHSYYGNLLGLADQLQTIKCHFLDYPKDLEKVRLVEKYIRRLQKLESKDFIETIGKIIDLLIPLIEGPIKYKINSEEYLIEWGNVKCISK